jgi:hypothetical protein
MGTSECGSCNGTVVMDPLALRNKLQPCVHAFGEKAKHFREPSNICRNMHRKLSDPISFKIGSSIIGFPVAVSLGRFPSIKGLSESMLDGLVM